MENDDKAIEKAYYENEIREHNLTLNKETMSYYDESGNEYRQENGQAIFYSDIS